MKRLKVSAMWMMAAGSVSPAIAAAEEAAKTTGGYSSADYVWFILIAVILGYGVYDTFFKPS